MAISKTISKEWENYLLMQMNKIVSAKSISEANKNKLELFIRIGMEYAQKAQGNDFLLSIMVLTPQLKEIEHRKLIAQSISRNIQLGKQKTIGE